ncbi:MAG: flagellar basal body P-ring protein FlgI [Caldisericaceae bacterium]|nr:flagellar basal body P-ring protein FlgI [Caldisericaceae bacterium]
MVKKAVVGLLILGFWMSLSQAQVRIKDVVAIENGNRISLIGYGLVVGLAGTGDRPSSRRGAIFTVQSISNMLERFGITVPREDLRTRNVAAVMVTAQIPPFSHVGSRFDVVVSSLGDATSLEGGVLLMTPLRDAAGNAYAMAQGPLSVGGFNVETTAGERLKKNHSLVGRIPDGGYLQVEPPNQNIDLSKPIGLHLNEPDFVTARRIADQINNYFKVNPEEKALAQPISPGLVQLYFPDSLQSPAQAVNYIAQIETLTVNVDVEARVVINERTGTIVAGGNVQIDEVMISHGNLTIHTMSSPVISQPAPFSRVGRTVVTRVTQTTAEEGEAKTAVIQKTTTVSELASALNTLGLKPRDIIAIFQAIKEAGALKAKLIIN